VVTGKSERGTERLPGSIFEVADEIEARGGRAMAVRLDVRDEEQVRAMVDAVVTAHGRIDILVNNAGALWWERVLDTPSRRADLIWQVNVRGAYLCSYHVLPHMVAGGWGHILNCSPPISTDPSPGHVMYMASKMGMTRLAIGIAAEHHDDNVAANSLWPATPIESYATINWDDAKTGRPEQWRTPEILCDAASEIFATAPGELTGRQLIDEDFLRERGWSEADLGRYWLHGAPPAEVMWIDGRPGAVM
jgi:citronellol/citronellal dehydrogenase